MSEIRFVSSAAVESGPMVRRDDADKTTSVSRCSSPAGASPASVSAGAPSSRPRVRDESRVAQAGCQKPLRREPVRGPQHEVKLAASSDLQPERRAGHVAAKTMSRAFQSGDARAREFGGVGSAARGHGDERNTRGPSAPPGSGPRGSYQPMAKSSRAQRESEGIVVLVTAAANNAVRGKGPCFGRARNEGKCQGMAGTTGPNHPDAHQRVVNARQPRHELWTLAKRLRVPMSRLRTDLRSVVRVIGHRGVHAASGRPSVSRVPEIGMHGLKGGPALSPMTINV
jgi:hypothetical protein